MNNSDDEEKVMPPEQPREEDSIRRKRRLLTLLAALVAVALIIGLSVGLTRPTSNDSNALKGSNIVPTTPTNPPNDPPVDEPPTGGNVVLEGVNKFESKGKIFDARMNIFSPAVLDGYSNGDELRADLDQSVRFFVNNFIEQQVRYNDDQQRFPKPDFVSEIMDDSSATGGDVPESSPSAEGATDFETNNQEEGVDEADLVKSDGTYVYAAYGDVLVVWEALTGNFVVNYTLPAPKNPPQGGGKESGGFMQEDIGIIVDDPMYTYTPEASIRGISLESDRLVLYVEGYGPQVKEQMGVEFACYEAFSTRIVILDTTTPSQGMPVLAEKDIQGSYRDARCIGSKCHVVASCNFDLWSLTNDIYLWNLQGLNATEYREQAAVIVEPKMNNYVNLMYEAITAHVDDGEIPNMPKISLWQSTVGANKNVVAEVNSGGAIQAFLGLISFDPTVDGELELGSAGVCTPSSWGFTTAIKTDDNDGMLVFAARGWDFIPEVNGTGQTTYLMGFGLEGINAKPALIGSVPGYVQSERAVGIYDGHLRVATTIDVWWDDMDVMPVESDGGTGDGADPVIAVEEPVFWPRPRNVVQNQVIILKIPSPGEVSVLEEVARIPDLGEEGERIQAVRYFGHIGYAVTFLQTDPFYVLDLTPATAAVLGELKITGFSAYLHSINANNTLLVGVGEEADTDGRILGIQVSLFDASDPRNPKLLNKTTVEKDRDTWSSSEVMWDFQAFRYLPLGDEVGIVIMPVRVESWNQGTIGNFDGFYVYDVSRDGGIVLRMTISHVKSQDFYGCYASNSLPQRSLVFAGNVTTLKGHSVVSTDLDTGKEGWTFELPQPSENSNGCIYW